MHKTAKRAMILLAILFFGLMAYAIITPNDRDLVKVKLEKKS